ncbi:MAG: hypothetical protein M4D80_26405 [Myxococcota bacterium]|nr:hypothetical protein [Myxococcota bacterium]
MRALLIIALLAAPAYAGRTYFGWFGGTDVLDERAVELQTRLTERNDLGDTRIRDTTLWVGPQIGITKQLELTLPVEMIWASAVGFEQDFALRRYGADLRYRFTDRDKAIAPLVMLSVTRDVVRRDVIHAELDAAVSYTFGRIYAAGAIGVVGDVNRGGLRLTVRPAVAASVGITGDLRAGAELHAELERDSGATSWIVAGPSASWTHGRFWLSATYGIGVKNISSAPRLVWAMAF